MYLPKNRVRRMLPELGETLMETPTYVHSRFFTHIKIEPQECVVVMVNRKHLWYMVRFKESGLRECYKVPKLGTVTPEVVFK